MKSEQTYLQCCHCGEIYIVQRKAKIENLYINSCCPNCEHGRAINLGSNTSDIYLFYDVTLDDRYFNYDNTKLFYKETE